MRRFTRDYNLYSVHDGLHLFYTFLAIFAATAVVTLLGITNVVRIGEGYLTALVGAFLIELAGAAIAIFRTAKFFDDDERQPHEELARLKVANEDLARQLDAASVTISARHEEITKLQDENRALAAQLERASSLRARILGILGSESYDRSGILRELHVAPGTPESAWAIAVVGELVDEKKIEADPKRVAGYYRLRST